MGAILHQQSRQPENHRAAVVAVRRGRAGAGSSIRLAGRTAACQPRERPFLRRRQSAASQGHVMAADSGRVFRRSAVSASTGDSEAKGRNPIPLDNSWQQA